MRISSCDTEIVNRDFSSVRAMIAWGFDSLKSCLIKRNSMDYLLGYIVFDESRTERICAYLVRNPAAILCYAALAARDPSRNVSSASTE